MNNSPTLIIDKLEIMGLTKSYEIFFKEGINIIWGDLDCGKSSILGIIAYCLGASNLDSYGELETRAHSARVSVTINSDKYIFERNLFKPDSYIKGFKKKINPAGPSVILSPDLDGDAPDGYIAFYIMGLMGLPIAKIKVSPSKTDSTLNRVSFKDVLKFLYLKQKEIASDTMLNMSEKYRYVKNKEILKFLLNIHNELISEIEAELAENQKELNSKKNERRDILKFLGNVGFEQLSDDVFFNDSHEIELTDLEKKITEIKHDYNSASGTTELVERRLKELNDIVITCNEVISNLNDDLSNFIKLRNSYNEEKKSITLSLKLHKDFHAPLDIDIKCPLCKHIQRSNEVDSTISVEYMNSEKSSLNKKILSLNDYIEKTRNKLEINIKTLQKARSDIHDLQYSFNDSYARQVSELVETISLLENYKANLIAENKIKERDSIIQNKIDMLTSEENNLQKAIDILNVRLIEAKEKSEGKEKIISKLSTIFRWLMSNSLLQNVSNSHVNDNLDFIVRDKILTELTSGGVRTITSLSTYMSFLIFSIINDSNIPSFLMIDTPGNNIGRYRTVNTNGDEIASDQKIYERVYEQLYKIYELANKKERKFQVIIVDNDLAEFAANRPNEFHIAKRFSKHDSNYDYGLINDYKSQ
ncbi:AAA family ATPase [Klebsiella michiganensis]|uniref:AAA family ATPase n=1 Tax=Klebsiella michiganensis TaxID=1134687 RepID=UPI0012B9DE4E|nr:AAA family ATPase [Klebsiella michiganensis]